MSIDFLKQHFFQIFNVRLPWYAYFVLLAHFSIGFRTLFPRFLFCSFFRSSIKKNFEKLGLSQFWLANIICVRIIKLYMYLLERRICFKVVEGASIMR